MKNEPHVLGGVPIFEYPANAARMGAFEVILPLLDAINETESNRLDDVVQPDNGNRGGLWIGVALAVLVVAIIVVVILIKRKKA